MTTVLRASGSAEFLGIVPSLVGFTPVESLVLLPFHASRTTGAMRLDLPRDDVELDEYADTAIALVARVERTDAVAVVVYTDDEPVRTPDGIVLPFAVEVEAVLGCAIDAGLRIVDALCVTPSGWAGYLDEEPELGDLDDLDGVAMPGVGDVSGDQVSGVGLPTVDLARTERVGRTLRDITAVIDGAGGPELRVADPQTLGAVLLLKDVPALFESVLAAPEDLPAHAVAALLWCLDRPLFRDVALAQWGSDLTGGLRTLDAQLAFAASGARSPTPNGCGERSWSHARRRPQPRAHPVRHRSRPPRGCRGRWAAPVTPRATSNWCGTSIRGTDSPSSSTP